MAPGQPEANLPGQKTGQVAENVESAKDAPQKRSSRTEKACPSIQSSPSGQVVVEISDTSQKCGEGVENCDSSIPRKHEGSSQGNEETKESEESTHSSSSFEEPDRDSDGTYTDTPATKRGKFRLNGRPGRCDKRKEGVSQRGQRPDAKTHIPVNPQSSKKARTKSKYALLRHITRLNVKKRELKAKVTHLGTKNAELENTLVERKERQLLLVRNFQEAQEEAMSLLRNSEAKTLPGEVVRMKADTIINKFQCWVKRNAVPSVKSWAGIDSEVRNMLVGKTGSCAWTSERCPGLAKRGSLTIRMILMAAMTRQVFLEVINDCFFWLRCRKGEKEQRLLRWTDDLGSTMSIDDLTLWRSLTVQMLHRPESESTSATNRQILQQKSEFYERCADRGLESCDALLQPLESDKIVERREELIGMIRSFDEFSASLYAQNIRIRVLASEEDFKEIGETTFSATSRLMSAHASLKLHDKDDKSRDGSAIDLLIQPAMIAYNRKRSETDNECRVWLKAVVWMGDDSHDDITSLRTNGGKIGTSNGNRTSTRSREVIHIDDSVPKGESVDSMPSDPRVKSDSPDQGPKSDLVITNTEVPRNMSPETGRINNSVGTESAKSDRAGSRNPPEKDQKTQAKRPCDDFWLQPLLPQRRKGLSKVST